jgi:hypothetical protein
MAPAPPLRRVSLPPLHEFRFELEPNETIAITLLQGTAEVFGFELVPGQPHPFGDEVRAAVWTSGGAELEMSSLFFPLVLGGMRFFFVRDAELWTEEAQDTAVGEGQLTTSSRWLLCNTSSLVSVLLPGCSLGVLSWESSPLLSDSRDWALGWARPRTTLASPSLHSSFRSSRELFS